MFSKSSLVVILLLSSGLMSSSLKLSGVARSLVKRDTEFQRQSLSPRTDSELDEDSRQHMDKNRLLASISRSLQLLSMANNGADMAPQALGQQHRTRQQRSASLAATGELNQSPSILPLQSLAQQLVEDERTIGRELPDLIVQAHNDKAMERALLKMLINASLRSSLSNVVAPQSGVHYSQALQQEGGWRDGDNLATNNFRDSSAVAQLASASLEPTVDELGGLDSFAGDSGRLLQLEQYPSGIDKREYTKPCSVNAVSCAKGLYRKLA